MNRSDKQRLSEQITEAVAAKVGGVDAGLREVIAQEVEAALSSPNGERVGAALQHAASEIVAERVVITANGRNRGGVVAALATCIDEFKGDIRDISQTIVGEYFTMIIVVDVASATRQGSRFGLLRERLTRLGEDLGIHVVAMHDDILSSMHSV